MYHLCALDETKAMLHARYCYEAVPIAYLLMLLAFEDREAVLLKLADHTQ